MTTLTRSKRRQGLAGISGEGATPRDHRRFLVEVANLPQIQTGDDAVSAAWSRFTRKFGHWLASLDLARQGVATEDGTADSPFGIGSVIGGAWLGGHFLGGVAMLSELLRRAWSEPTPAEREIGILAVLVDLAQFYASKSGRRFALVQEPLAPALLQAIHAADLMRICQNPDCPARYFIADRRTQKFCSEKCAGPAQREAKRRWWSEHGNKWKKQRERKAKRKPRRIAKK
jgi:hypothetical protein